MTNPSKIHSPGEREAMDDLQLTTAFFDSLTDEQRASVALFIQEAHDGLAADKPTEDEPSYLDSFLSAVEDVRAREALGLPRPLGVVLSPDQNTIIGEMALRRLRGLNNDQH